MTRSLIVVVSLALCLAFGALAADAVTGKWVAQVPGRDGQTREQTFNLKAEGATLTGSVSGRQNDTPISDGKVDGNNISFSVKMERGGNTVEQKYSGTVAGDEMKLKREGGQGQAREFTAKRAK